MISELEKYINKCVKISEAEMDQIVGIFERVKFSKKSMLLQHGEVCKFEGFIIKGCVKTYFINKDGVEVILAFATENWWVSDIMSFQEQTPSNMFIETLEDTEMLVLTKAAKEELLDKHPVLEKMFRLMIQRHLYSYQERLFGNIALTAEERYDIFLKKYPALPQRIPQHLIASYLGISAEFLSRLRAKRSKK